MAHTTQHTPKPQTLTPGKHPDEFERDLNPNAMAGQNLGHADLGHAGPHAEQHTRTLFDDKPLHARFRDWADDDLKQVPILAAGTRLEQGATYIDLTEEPPREFTATGDMQASRHHRMVPKSAVPYELWNRLLEIENVTRTGIAPER